MTTLTVNIENKKTEKAVKAVLDALGLDYNIDSQENKNNKNPQSLEGYNKDLDDGNEEIDKGHFIAAEDLLNESRKW